MRPCAPPSVGPDPARCLPHPWHQGRAYCIIGGWMHARWTVTVGAPLWRADDTGPHRHRGGRAWSGGRRRRHRAGRVLGPVGSSGPVDRRPLCPCAGSDDAGRNGDAGVSGDGQPAVDADLHSPSGVVEDRAGDLFIADTGNCRVREVPARSGTSFGIRVQAGHIVTVAGGPCRAPARNPEPVALALDAAGRPVHRLRARRPGRGAAGHGTPGSGHRRPPARLVVVAGTGVAGFGGDGGAGRPK